MPDDDAFRKCFGKSFGGIALYDLAKRRRRLERTIGLEADRVAARAVRLDESAGFGGLIIGAGHVLDIVDVPRPVLVTAVLALALGFQLERLAQFTSLVVLSVFAPGNHSLVCIKCRGEGETPSFRVPLRVPVTGSITCIALIASQFM